MTQVAVSGNSTPSGQLGHLDHYERCEMAAKAGFLPITLSST